MKFKDVDGSFIWPGLVLRIRSDCFANKYKRTVWERLYLNATAGVAEQNVLTPQSHGSQNKLGIVGPYSGRKESMCYSLKCR